MLNLKVLPPDLAIKRLAADLRPLPLPKPASKILLRLLREATQLIRNGEARSAAATLKKFQSQVRSNPALARIEELPELAETVEAILSAIYPGTAVISPFVLPSRTQITTP